MNGLIICLFVLILNTLGLHARATEDRCSIANVEAAKHECHDVFAGGHHGLFETICENVECYLQCLNDAIGDCNNQIHHFKEDMEVYKALYRVRCLNTTLTRLAEEKCDFRVPCVDDAFNKEQIDILKSTNMSSALKTKQIECRLSARSVSCITVQEDANCTAEMADLQKKIATLKHSLSQCNIPQEHALFKIYGGEINCQNAGNACFTSKVTSRMSTCEPTIMAMFMQKNQSAISEICDYIECTSQCYTDAIGECHKEDKFVMLDPETIKISARAACDNIDDFTTTIQQCRMRDTTCLRTLATSMSSAQNYIHLEKYSEYKSLVCGAVARFRSCISFDVTENCTESMAVLAKNMYEVWHSYSACGPVENDLFQKYSGALTCNSGEKVERSRNNMNVITPPVLIGVLLLVVQLFWQQN